VQLGKTDAYLKCCICQEVCVYPFSQFLFKYLTESGEIRESREQADEVRQNGWLDHWNDHHISHISYLSLISLV